MNDAVAVVTGGNRGIGSEIGRQLVQLGMQVVLTSRDVAKGEATCAKINAECGAGGGRASTFQLDVTDAAGIKAPPLLGTLGLPTKRGGQLEVDAQLRVKGEASIYALGDCAGRKLEKFLSKSLT